MRIDAHHHLWDLSVRDQPWTADLPALRRSFGVDDIRPLLADAAIDATIVVQTVADETETYELLALAAREPLVTGVVGWVDVTADDVEGRLAALQERPGGDRLVGIRHSIRDDPDPQWLLREDVRRGLTGVQRAGLAFDLLISPDQLGLAAETAQAMPDLRFVLDHAAQPRVSQGEFEPWLSGITQLAAAPNTSVKLSGLVNQVSPDRRDELAAYADTLFTAFGPDRMLFGSDWPVCLLSGSYSEVVELTEALCVGLTIDERAAVFGTSAMDWYHLDVWAPSTPHGRPSMEWNE